MNYLFLNLKRFDITPENGGVNSIAEPAQWGASIARQIADRLSIYADSAGSYSFPVFFPEAHIIPAASALEKNSLPVFPEIGCQGVYHRDTEKGGNFGAFTTLRTACSAKQLGCSWVIIGHSEERRAKAEYMELAGASKSGVQQAVGALLAQEVSCALKAGLKVLFCIGEKEEEVPARREVLQAQLSLLNGMDLSQIVVAYEPIWAIGPGKTPPAAQQIAETARLVKSITPCPLVYGGGLKKENAEEIGALPELDGGLIALTRFTGSIGFYPDEYAEIIKAYIGAHRT